ncbi:hypothetical protein H9P43_002026 [Blastocladiella emersonii ATCC 22665]|nr:hypothetical protein H9P43_002026 [Blastocladiella emersonii ATCC 22665]
MARGDATTSAAEGLFPPSRSIRLWWTTDTEDKAVDYRRELLRQSPGSYEARVSRTRIVLDGHSSECQLAIISFHDIRDAQAAMKYWNGRKQWGVKIEAHFLIPKTPAHERTPCSSPNNEGSLRIDLRPQAAMPADSSRTWLREFLSKFGGIRSFDVTQESRDGSLVAFVEFYDNRARLEACEKLNNMLFRDYTIRAELAWDAASVDIVKRIMSRESTAEANSASSSIAVSDSIPALNALAGAPAPAGPSFIVLPASALASLIQYQQQPQQLQYPQLQLEQLHQPQQLYQPHLQLQQPFHHPQLQLQQQQSNVAQPLQLQFHQPQPQLQLQQQLLHPQLHLQQQQPNVAQALQLHASLAGANNSMLLSSMIAQGLAGGGGTGAYLAGNPLPMVPAAPQMQLQIQPLQGMGMASHQLLPLVHGGSANGAGVSVSAAKRLSKSASRK